MGYKHLNINERTIIHQLYFSGLSLREISRVLNRNVSTISRELRRNSVDSTGDKISDVYSPAIAQDKYESRKSACGRKQISDETVINYVREKIELHWSPDQIYNADVTSLNIPSTSTIYRMIHSKRLGKITMERLRRKGTFKRPAETRGKFNDRGRTIKKRDKEVYKRHELGHWEGDTVESGRPGNERKSKACFVTLVERKSRFYIAVKVPNRTSEVVTSVIIKALKQFPSNLVKTITFDRGKEFSGYLDIERELECNTYFCDPYCAWQKGTNENTNGLLREFYPKGMDLSQVDENQLIHNLQLLNSRPRKCLNYKTPLEILYNSQ